MKKNIGVSKTVSVAAIATVLASTLSCVYPTHNDSDFFEEQQSVWQYLKVYSIHHDRLPAQAGSLSPMGMFEVISDTLGGHMYTGYYYPPGSGGGNPVPELPEPAVDAVTNSTVYFGFYEFEDRELDAFNAFVDYMADFDNIVIDLRFNGGGLISVVRAMANEFLPPGTGFVEYRYRRYNSGTLRGEDAVEIAKTVNANPKLVGKNISVLVNEWSASSSEILVSALKDGANAYIVGGLTNEILVNALTGGGASITGERTYGKGRGQSRITRPGREMLSITYMEVRGVSERTGDYHRVGIEPDPVPTEYLLEALPSILKLLGKSEEWLFEAIEADNDPRKPDMTVRAIREFLEYYFAVKAVEPDVMIIADDDEEDGEPAMFRRQLARQLKSIARREPVVPRITGAYVVDTDELFR